MTKPLKADGTSPPIGRFLIGHLTKVNSVRTVLTFNTFSNSFELYSYLCLDSTL